MWRKQLPAAIWTGRVGPDSSTIGTEIYRGGEISPGLSLRELWIGYSYMFFHPPSQSNSYLFKAPILLTHIRIYLVNLWNLD